MNFTSLVIARGLVHARTIEGLFSNFKGGMKGVYQHCSEAHLHRYLTGFDFRYSHRVKLGHSDEDRTLKIMEGIKGKRLTYRRPSEAGYDPAESQFPF